jgi:hypothetical protein
VTNDLHKLLYPLDGLEMIRLTSAATSWGVAADMNRPWLLFMAGNPHITPAQAVAGQNNIDRQNSGSMQNTPMLKGLANPKRI